MLTFLPFMSTIQGCSSIRQGVALRGGSFSRLKSVRLQLFNQGGGVAQYIPALNKVFETIRPADTVLRFILQLGNRLADDIGQKVDQTGARLHLGAVGREGEAMLCDFEQGYTERPNVGCDGIRLTGDSLRCHIVRGSDERVGITLGSEFTANSKVAQLHLAVSA